MTAISDPADPRCWGIDDASVDRFDTVWQPRASTPPFDPDNVPAAIRDEFPTLLRNRSTVSQGLYWETRPPHPAAAWPHAMAGWNIEAQSAFDALWPSVLDREVDLLIEEFGSLWHSAFAVQAPVRWPWLIDLLEEHASTGSMRITGTYAGQPTVAASIALVEGPYRTTLRRRGWPFPNRQHCEVCGVTHYADTIRYYLIRHYGRPGICAACLSMAYLGPSTPVGTGAPDRNSIGSLLSLDDALCSLMKLHKLTGVIPPAAFRQQITTMGMEPGLRARTIAALATTPDSAHLRSALGGVSWLKVLQAAGLVGETWRPSRGVMCIASDGHACRSLGEKTVCDWLDARGIAHSIEPKWPKHPHLNPRGLLRADWQIGSVYVELAGMMSDPGYAGKMASKRKLAKAAGIELVILLPEDLYHLDKFLGAVQ